MINDELDLLGVNCDGGRRPNLLLVLRIAETDAAFVEVVVELYGAVRKRLQQVLRCLRGGGRRGFAVFGRDSQDVNADVVDGDDDRKSHFLSSSFLRRTGFFAADAEKAIAVKIARSVHLEVKWKLKTSWDAQRSK